MNLDTMPCDSIIPGPSASVIIHAIIKHMTRIQEICDTPLVISAPLLPST